MFSRKQTEVVTNSSLPLKQLVSLVFPVHESFLVVCSSCQERRRSQLDIHTGHEIPQNSPSAYEMLSPRLTRLHPSYFFPHSFSSSQTGIDEELEALQTFFHHQAPNSFCFSVLENSKATSTSCIIKEDRGICDLLVTNATPPVISSLPLSLGDNDNLTQDKCTAQYSAPV